MKKYLGLTVVALIICLLSSFAFVPEVQAGDKEVAKEAKVEKDKQPKDKQLLKALQKNGIDVEYVELVKDYSKSNPYSKLYKDRKSNALIQIISTLPRVNTEGEEINARWLSAGDKYYADANLFGAEVLNTQISLTRGSESLAYQPQVYLDDNEVKASSEATLLGIDPINENYYQNTLVWDYGICTRSLRLIEGSLQGTWVFEKNPKGDVRIVYNHSGTLDLKLGQFAASDDSELITREVFDDAKYPLIIGDTWTGNSSASDGRLFSDESDPYANVWNSVNCTIIDTGVVTEIGQQRSIGRYKISKIFVFFDTGGIQDEEGGYDLTINAATLSLYGNADFSDDDFEVTIQNGQPTYPHDPLIEADCDRTLYSGNGGNITTVGWNTAGYNDITMTEAGISWIKTGAGAKTKLALRSSNDINGVAPPGQETVAFYFSEQGTGYEPKLVVTFASPLVLWIEWEYGTTFTDLSGTGNDATPTFRTASSDADLSASITAQEGLVTGSTPSTDVTGGWTMVSSVPGTPDNLFTEGDDSYAIGGFNIGELITDVAEGAGQDATAWHIIIVFALALFAALGTFGATHNMKLGQRGSLILSALAAEGVLIIFYRFETIPGFALIPFGILALGLVVLKKSHSPVD